MLYVTMIHEAIGARIDTARSLVFRRISSAVNTDPIIHGGAPVLINNIAKGRRGPGSIALVYGADKALLRRSRQCLLVRDGGIRL